MTHTRGQIAEYGTDEFNNNKSVRTVLETAKISNASGIIRDIELYHRSEGYKPAGSCSIWTNEVYGYTIYFSDGTTGGKFGDFDFILDAWSNMALTERKIISE